LFAVISSTNFEHIDNTVIFPDLFWNPMQIRQATQADSDAIRYVILSAAETGRADFDTASWIRFVGYMDPPLLHERLCNPTYLTLCGLLDAKLVGVIAMREYARINQLFVLQEYRHRGVAHQLWEQARDICLAQGNKTGFRVRSSTMAVPVYQSFGFKLCGDSKVQNGVRFTPMRLEID